MFFLDFTHLRRSVRKVVLISAFLSISPLFSQENEPLPETKVKPYSLRLKGEYRSLELVTSDQTAEALVSTEYLPNVPAMAGIDLAYQGIGFAVTMKVPGTGKDTAKYGTSSAQDYLAYYFGHRWGADLYYQKYSGYYAQYPNGKLGATASDVRPDIKASYIGGNFYFSLNEGYNIRSGFRHDNLINGFRFGFLIGTSLNYSSISADRSLLQPIEETKFPQYAGYRNGEYWNLSLMPGVGLMYSESGRFFASLILLVGGGVSQANMTVNAGSDSRVTDNYRGHAKVTLGVNTESFQTGMAFMSDFTGAGAFNLNTYVIGSNLLALDVFINLRF
jgi:hypothetical protein